MNSTILRRPGTRDSSAPCTVVGVGIGPSNLSLAALAEPVAGLTSRFFERRCQFQWHPGQLLPGTTIQVSALKDLVTLVDPTSRYSFLAFLATNRRLYRFIAANFPAVRRSEFNQYYQWVSRQLPNLVFDAPVHAITHDHDGFRVHVGGGEVPARNIVLGTGLVPNVPDCCRPLLCDTLFHASEFLDRSPVTRGKSVALIGGGQTAAELALHLLSAAPEERSTLSWLTRRPNFLPIDDSPFTNEHFMPSYSRYFFDLPWDRRRRLLEEQKLESDGIARSLLEDIYRRIYENAFLEPGPPLCQLLAGIELVDLRRDRYGWEMEIRDTSTGQHRGFRADVVILCTGFVFRAPECLAPLMERIHLRDGLFAVRDDFSIEWDGPREHRIFAQNAARHVRGIADPNLSLVAWRSAVILNRIAGTAVYDVEDCGLSVEWGLPVKEEAGAR